MKRVLLIFILLLGTSFAAHSQELTTSNKYSLTMHIVRIGEDKTLDEGTTVRWHIATASIEGRTYGLRVLRRSWRPLDWLHVGNYPCRRTKHGCELQYEDGGKVHEREFVIVSEE